MLIPKKVKYRKWHRGGRGKTSGVETRGTEISFGSYGLKALESGWITARQLEASRRTILRYLKKRGKLWIRIFPYKPITSKGIEVPMGGGKGSVEYYVFPTKAGRILFELDGVTEDIAKEAFKKAQDKLPIKTKFVKK
jgi:large subunit ribosomal protein L16